MKKVFFGYPVEAHLLKGLLKAEGIEAEVRDEALFGFRAAVPETPFPSLWILDDSNEERALAVIARHKSGEGSSEKVASGWRCPKCGEEIEGQFTTCWKCGTAASNEQ